MPDKALKTGLTPRWPALNLEALLSFMAENNPNAPAGGLPPKPPEAAKVQPKKETVRISLPPKPTATIKLPTLPAGGPTASAPAASPGVVPPPAAPQAPRSPTAAPAAAPAHRPPTAAPAGVARPAAPLPSARPAPAAPAVGARRVSGIDTVLAIVGAVLGLGAVGYLFLGILSMK